jgi:uncharacterized protein (TIGR02594 family)
VVTLEEQLVAVARAELGKGETGLNNSGPDIVRYRAGLNDNQPWCAAFVSYCYLRSAKAVGVKPVRRSHSAKVLGRLVAKAGQVLEQPEPGCVVVWHRGAPGSAFGHIGVCEEYDPATDTLVTIEGNRGSFPSVVTRYRYPNGKWREHLELIATTRKA